MTEEMKLLNEKVDYLTKLVEHFIEETKPCKKAKNNNNEALLKILESSPLSKNPMFVQMMEPLKDILNKV